jgi:hypothetical protein
MNSVWIAAALVVATFDISKDIGPDGKPIEPLVDYDKCKQSASLRALCVR